MKQKFSSQPPAVLYQFLKGAMERAHPSSIIRRCVALPTIHKNIYWKFLKF